MKLNLKKSLLSLACAALVCGTASSAILFRSSCGKQTLTVGFEAFQSTEEAIEYYLYLDEVICDSGVEYPEYVVFN